MRACWMRRAQRAETGKSGVRDLLEGCGASADIDTILRTALKELGTALDASEAVIELWPE